MSSTIKHKLIQHEEVPPPQAWAGIEEELNRAEGDARWKEKLLSLSVTPPAHLWNSIENSLLSSQETKVAAKLYETEVTPPPSAWGVIERAIKPSPVRRMPSFARYAAAAMLIGLLGFTAIKLFLPSRSSGETINPSGLAKAPDTADRVLPVPRVVATVNEDGNPAREEARNDAALENSKRTYAKLDVNRMQKKRIASNFTFASNDETVINGSEQDLSDRYIVLMTPEGNFIRVSKKLSDMVCCVSGEEQDAECKEQVDKWRKQIATAHSGNFGDILSLLSSLQKDN